MRARLFLLAVFALVFIKGRCQIPVWAISGSFTSIAADNKDHFYIINNNNLSKYDTSGNVLWQRTIGAPIESLATATDNTLYISGNFSAALQLGDYALTPAGSGSIYVARLDEEGVVQWAKQLDRSARGTQLQLATDSRNSVYVAWVEATYFYFTKFWPRGATRFTKSVVLGQNPYGEPFNVISVDRQDNLHVVYSSPFVPNPADPLNTINAQSRAWYDSTGVLLGSERNIKQATREEFRGYKAKDGPRDYLYTKTYRTLTGSGLTWLSDCSGPQVHCYDFPPINPDYDRYRNAYYAGHFYERGGGIDCGPPPSSLDFFCTNAVTRKEVVYLEKDIYVRVRDTLISTKDHGLTDEIPIRLVADPNGRSLYLLASWSKRADSSTFYFGKSVLVTPGRMVLRYRVDRPSIQVQAGEDKVICPGGSAAIGSSNLALGGKAPYTYSWQPVTGLSNAQAPDPIASPGTSTEYIVTVTDATGAEGRDTVNVVVDPDLYRPTITLASGANPFCEGDIIGLKASDAVSYQWSNGAVAQAISIAAPGTYIVTAVSGEGCRGTSLPFVATMNPRPPVPLLKQRGNALTVEPAAAAYRWYLNEVPIPEATGSLLGIEKGGEYTVVITDKNGCSNRAALTAVKRILTDWIDYQVYPNPVTSDMHIVYTLRHGHAMSIILKDVLGQKVAIVLEQQQQSPGEYHLTINKAAARLQKGQYYIEFRSGTKRIVHKVMVM